MMTGTNKTMLRFLAAALFAVVALAGAPKQAQAACTGPSGNAGDIIYNTDNNILQYCNDSLWVGLGGGNGGGAALLAPTSMPDIIYCSGYYFYKDDEDGTSARYDNPQSASYTYYVNATGAKASSSGAPAAACPANISSVTKYNMGGSGGGGGGGAMATTNTGYLQIAGGGGALADSGTTAGQQLFWDNTSKVLGIGTATPNGNAILDLTSTTKAFLPPRMTTAQRDAITSPAVGMTVFNTDTGGLDTYGPVQAAGGWSNMWLTANGALRGLGRGTSGDYNTIVSNAYPQSAGGVWWMDGPGSVNGPTGTNTGVLLNLDPLYNVAASRNKYAIQLATVGTNSSPLYYRAQSNGTWGAWVTLGGSSGVGGGGNTMHPAFPDAIKCTDGTSSVVLYLNSPNSTGTISYEAPVSGTGGRYYILFNTPAGTYNAQSNMGTYDCVTASKSIATLYSEGKAYNFIGNTSAAAAGTTNEIQFREGGNLQADSRFVYDNVNDRVGIGTATPGNKLHILGGTALGVSANAQSPLVVEGGADFGNGNVNIQLIADRTKTSQLVFTDQDANAAVVGYNHSTDNMVFSTVSTMRMTIDSAGNVGIGVTPTNTATEPKLQVAGAIVSTVNNAAAATTINFATSNVAYTTAACGAFTLQNMADGGSYTLVVKGSGTGPATFTHAGLTAHTTGTLTCTSAKHTVFSFIRAGTDFYVTMITGY